MGADLDVPYPPIWAARRSSGMIVEVVLNGYSALTNRGIPAINNERVISQLTAGPVLPSMTGRRFACRATVASP